MPHHCRRCGAPAAPDGPCPTCGNPPPASPRLPEPGHLFAGRFRIGEVLGRGGMGLVYRAEDLILGEAVALKVIRPELLDRPQVLARFLREVTLARKLAHPNICRIHDLGEAEGLRYISMQLVEGESLESRLRARGPLPAGEVRHLAERLLRALEVAHRRGIIHRDIKPKNIVVGPDGEPVLMDFGIAKNMGPAPRDRESTLAGVSVGTPAYMAPEVAMGGPASPASDLYALGITVFKLLTGRLPFEGDNSYLVLRQQVESPAPAVRSLRPDAPDDLSELVRGALEKEPSRRFPSAAAARRVLRAERREDSPAGAGGREDTAVGPVLRRRRGRLAALAVTAAGVAAALAWLGRVHPPAVAGPVAVLPFREGPDLGPLAGSGSVVADMLIAGLGRGTGLKVLSRLKIEQLARGSGQAPLDALVAAGAGRVVSGTLARGGGRVRIEAQLVDPRSGAIVESFIEEGPEQGALFDVVDALAEALAPALGGGRATSGVAVVTTRSLEAYQAYDRGVRALGRGDLRAARAELERAVATDPDFALAWSRLGAVAAQLGLSERARLAVREALDRGERLEASERELVRGAAARFERRWDAALGHLGRYLRDHPGDVLAALAAAECEIGRRAWDRAIARLEPLVAADPTLALAYDRLGAAYLGRRQYDRALEWFESQARRAPRSPLPPLGAGRVLLARHEVDRAEAAFRAALAIDPGFLPALIGTGDVALSRRDHATAEQRYREARERVPEALEPLAALGRLHLAMREPARARAELEELVRRDPLSHEGLEGIGLAWLQERTADEARAWFERALEADPYFVDARLRLARLAQDARRFDVAAGELERAARIDPHDVRVLIQRGQLLRLQRRFDQAREAAEAARARDPFEPEALNLLGLIADDLFDFEAAAGWYEKAVALDPYYLFARNNLGVAKVRSNEPGEALRQLRRAVEIDPYEPVSAANLGLLLGLTGNETESARWFERARTLDPGSTEVALAEAGLLRTRGRHARALTVLARAAPGSGRDERLAFERGRVLVALGRRSEAVRAFEEALEIHPRMLEAALGAAELDLARGDPAAASRRLAAAIEAGDAAGAVRAGRALLAAGREAEGRSWLARALEDDPDNPWVAYDAAQAEAEAGNRSQALALLLTALERGFRDAGLLVRDPAFAALRGDPEFVRIAGRLGVKG